MMGPFSSLPSMPAAAPGALRPAPAQSLPPTDFGGFQPPGAGPADTVYEAVTQADGSVLLHLKLPDGSLGPAVKIVTPPRGKGAGAAPIPGLPAPGIR